MSRVDVRAVLTVYEVDGKDVPELAQSKVAVASHWNRHDMVVIEIGDKRYTVVARDLSSAIQSVQAGNR